MYLLLSKGTQNHPHVVLHGIILCPALSGRSKIKPLQPPAPGARALKRPFSAPNENAAVSANPPPQLRHQIGILFRPSFKYFPLEICFIGKDKIVAMGNPVMTKNSEYNVWNKINLKTAKATKQWDDRSKEEQYSNNEWYVYKEKKGKLHLKHLAYETSIDIPDVKTVHIIDDAGDYVLFDDDQGNDYLCNLRNKTYKKFILPKKFRDDTQMYLAGKEKKMLVQHGKEIYLIDISDMYKNIQPRK